MRKGILLAGGTGTRLNPITKAVNKQLLPVYDKPLIYYPLSTLMKAEIDEILIIVDSNESQKSFELLLGNGEEFNICIDYAIQEKPEGIAQAFIIAEDFLDGSSCALALGDNIFYGHQFDVMLPNINDNQNVIFGCYVRNPERYGVAEFNDKNKVISIEEKPKAPKSNYAIPGLYFYNSTVVEKAKALKPSARGELEITDLNNLYIDEGKLDLIMLPEGTAWFDSGTFDDLLDAGQFVKAIQTRTGVEMAELKKISKRNGWM